MGFQTLQDIIEENRREREAGASQGPVSCPIDGEILEEGRGGILHCPLGNYTSG